MRAIHTSQRPHRQSRVEAPCEPTGGPDAALPTQVEDDGIEPTAAALKEAAGATASDRALSPTASPTFAGKYRLAGRFRTIRLTPR